MHDIYTEPVQTSGYHDPQRFMLPGATRHIVEEGATLAVSYAYDQVINKRDRFEDPAYWANHQSLRFCYYSNNPQLYQQLFVASFLRMYARAKRAFETGDYAIAPRLDRATQFWLFNQWAKDHSRDLAAPAVAGALSGVQEAAS